jgi:predicted DNA-binding protein
MKNKRLSFRLTERRYYKLLLLSAQLEKTMSSLVDEWIDSLPEPKKGSTTDA